MTTSNTPTIFGDLPAEAFPIRILTFSPTGELVWDSGPIGPYTFVQVPGSGPGSVRYTVVLRNDGVAVMRDDPTCAGTVQDNEIEIREGIPASEQESSFMNATLQSAGDFAFSVATHVDVPERFAVDEKRLAAYLHATFPTLPPNVKIEIELGPEDQQ